MQPDEVSDAFKKKVLTKLFTTCWAINKSYKMAALENRRHTPFTERERMLQVHHTVKICLYLYVDANGAQLSFEWNLSDAQNRCGDLKWNKLLTKIKAHVVAFQIKNFDTLKVK